MPLKTGLMHHWEFINPKSNAIFDVYNLPFSDTDGSPLILEMDIDITKRKKAEISLKRLATVVLDSNDAITLIDLDGKIQQWNHGAERLYGYGAEEAIGMELFNIVPEDKRAIDKNMMDRLRQGEDVESFETQRVAKDGHMLDVWLTVTALKNDLRKPYAIATTERDITKRKKAEEMLRESELKYRTLSNTLEESVKERTSELEQAYKSLQDIDIVRKQEIHHRIKNNLQVISSLLNLQAEKFRGKKNIEDS
jgi:PAS domain S-box-containing protein